MKYIIKGNYIHSSEMFTFEVYTEEKFLELVKIFKQATQNKEFIFVDYKDKSFAINGSEIRSFETIVVE